MTTVIYPRGFVGFDVGVVHETTKAREFLQTVKSFQLNRPIIAKNNVFPPNPDVDDLWIDYLNGSNNTASFAFRERILVTALKVFGTNNFFEWCSIQNTSAYTTNIHKKFLEDTFNFIRNGKRDVGILTWISLVKIDTENSSTRNVSINLSDFFGLKHQPNIRPSQTMVDNINFWVSHPSGFDDLLACLVIFFGSND